MRTGETWRGSGEGRERASVPRFQAWPGLGGGGNRGAGPSLLALEMAVTGVGPAEGALGWALGGVAG